MWSHLWLWLPAFFCTYWLFQPYGVNFKRQGYSPTLQDRLVQTLPHPRPPATFCTYWLASFFSGYRLHICFLHEEDKTRSGKTLLSNCEKYCGTTFREDVLPLIMSKSRGGAKTVVRGSIFPKALSQNIFNSVFSIFKILQWINVSTNPPPPTWALVGTGPPWNSSVPKASVGSRWVCREGDQWGSSPPGPRIVAGEPSLWNCHSCPQQHLVCNVRAL